MIMLPSKGFVDRIPSTKLTVTSSTEDIEAAFPRKQRKQTFLELS